MSTNNAESVKEERQRIKNAERQPHDTFRACIRSWFWNNKKLITIPIIGVFLVLFLLTSIHFIVRDTSQPDPDKVATDWQRAVSSLGLTAVFPPTEDVQVGDIFAVEYKRLNNEIFFRSIQLAHVAKAKMSIREYYHDLLRFPQSPASYDGKSPVQADKDIFTDQDSVKSLPIVALPNIVFATASTGTVNGIIPWFKSLFTAKRTSEDSVQIEIPEAETYGIPSAIATSLLDDFCVPDDSKPPLPPCTEVYMRRELSSVGWHRVFVPPINEQLTQFRSSEERANGIYLRFVRRVFLARRIEYSYGSDTVVGEILEQVRQKQLETDNNSHSTDSEKKGDPQNIHSVMDQTIQQLGLISSDAKIAIGGAAADRVTLAVPIARPLTIGYESITALPYPLVNGSQMNTIGLTK